MHSEPHSHTTRAPAGLNVGAYAQGCILEELRAPSGYVLSSLLGGGGEEEGVCCAAAAVTLALLADAPQEGEAAGDGATDAPARGSVLAEERVLGVGHRLRDQEMRQMLSLIAGGSAPWAVPAADGLAVLWKIALCVEDAYAPCLCHAPLPCTSGALLSCLLPVAMRFYAACVAAHDLHAVCSHVCWA